MELGAPLSDFGLVSDNGGLAVAVALGFAFGFALERAGFGSARKLTAVFYLHDMSVLKVMFTAIVTAMLGLSILSGIGWLDMSLIYLVPTFVLPQLVGGLMLGVGFVVGGYCPGTSVAGMATGRLDAMIYAMGLTAGLAFYAEIYSWIEPWVKVTSLGKITLPTLLGIPTGWLVLAVVVLAGAAFLGAERIEAAMRDRARH
jgi:uncharacterized membrane protein YedE/YeeE